MRALEFMRDHVTFKLPYDFSYHLKTPVMVKTKGTKNGFLFFLQFHSYLIGSYPEQSNTSYLDVLIFKIMLIVKVLDGIKYVYHQWVKNIKPINLSVCKRDQATNNGPKNYFKYVKNEIKVIKSILVKINVGVGHFFTNVREKQEVGFFFHLCWWKVFGVEKFLKRVRSYCTLEHFFSFQRRYYYSIVKEISGHLTVKNVSRKIFP